MKTRIDMEAGTITVGTNRFTINGIPTEIYRFLALKGAQIFLERRRNPLDSWNNLLQGNLEGRKPKPPSNFHVACQRLGLDPAKTPKHLPQIKGEILRIRADRLEGQLGATTPQPSPES